MPGWRDPPVEYIDDKVLVSRHPRSYEPGLTTKDGNDAEYQTVIPAQAGIQ